MRKNGHDPASVAEVFYAAANGAGGWDEALSALASLTGSFTGELLGFGGANSLAFYCPNAIAPDLVEDFKAARGYDPLVNSRVRIGLQSKPFDILDERHFSTSRDMARNPEYGAYIRKIDGPFLCLGNILQEGGMTVGLTVVRTEKQGNISDAERRAFADVLPHVRSAVRYHLLFEHRQIRNVAEAFDRVAIAAFICSAAGVVHAASKAAEALLQDERWLSTRNGVIVSTHPADTRRLHAALQTASSAGSGDTAPPRPFVVRDTAGDQLPLEATPYVTADGLRSAGLVVLLARPPRDLGARAAEVARCLFQLTEKETAIAQALVRGRIVSEIAREEETAVGTIRVHLRHIFEKVGVGNQAQLIAKLCKYL